MYLARLEILNFSLAVNNDRERRCLHAAKGSHCASSPSAEPQSKRTRRIDADEPVRLVPAPRCASQRLHFSVAPQSSKSLANRLGRHRLQPEAHDRFFRTGILDDIAKDQLTFAPGIACVDDVRDILILDELAKNVDAAAHFFRWREFKFRRHNG